MPSALKARDAVTLLNGGLDKETPLWSAQPGALRDALNYEVSVEGGYQDIEGYEAFDGSAAPSDASFTIVDITITGSIVAGDTVVGDTTGATGVVIAVATYPDNSAQTYMVLTKVTGTWDNASEIVLVAAANEGNTDALSYDDSAPTSKLIAQYNNLAADEYRADIAAVPGEGDVWGGFSLAALKYAIRDKTGGATAGLYKSSAAGWVEISLGVEIAFTGAGTYVIAEQDTVTGATNGATATVERIQITSGSFSGGDAVGFLKLSGQTGTFIGEDLDVGGDLNVATVAGDSSAITMAPGGRLDYVLSTFADPAGIERAYGADGVSLGWEFDGTVFARIRSGMVADTPSHVHVHKHQLFFSFAGSAQHSGPGDPFAWSVILGAAEIATGFTITGFDAQPGAEGNAALLIACRQRLFILYGSDTDDWNLVRYREKIGAYEWTLQQVAYTLFLDDVGITDLRTVQAFGNFDHAALSGRIRRLITAKRPLAIASIVVRDKNQYRLFFTDKTAIYVTMDGKKVMGMMPIEFNDQVTCAWSEEDSTGGEEAYFGSTDGFVYQMEKGTSFNGGNIFAFIYTHFDNAKSIEWSKEYYAPVTIEGKGTGYAEMDVSYELDYGRSEVGQPDIQAAVLPLGADALWDTGLLWDTGIVWDDSSMLPTLGLDLRGEGRNVSWIITKDSDYFLPVLLTGVHYRYIAKVQVRG
ncbi:MAG: hypothetical protein IIB77_00545 [Proteobacteria bacterium]|nr:hypothetical protein [Pseudomonadota bacterium]